MRTHGLLVVLLCGMAGSLLGCGSGSSGTSQPSSPPLAPAAQIFFEQLGSSSLVALPGGTTRFFGQGADPECGFLRYSWDFDGDGVEDSALQSPTHSFVTEGDHRVALTVTDGDGDTGTASLVISIRVAPAAGTTAPAVTLRCHTLLGETAMETMFIARAIDADGGSIASYDWDLDGDGVFESNTPTRSLEATLSGVGQFEAQVRANSSDGSSSTASLTYHLCAAGLIPELGSGAQVELDEEGTNSFVVGGTARFISTGADMDGGPTTTQWDTNDSGAFGAATGRMATSTAWTENRSHRVRARAVDDEGLTSGAQASYTIAPSPLPGGSNTAPSAQAQACTLIAPQSTAIQFIGTGGDPDGDQLTYSWDFDGDGVEDSPVQNPAFTFHTRGVYVPTLTVSDGVNETQAYLTLVVECCHSPSLPSWWCTCEDLVMDHGATETLTIDCSLLSGSLGPSAAVFAACAGQLGPDRDPTCAEITVDPAGLVAEPFSLAVTSNDFDGPPRAVAYTLTVRLEEPGVRIHVLTCDVLVNH